MYRFTFLLSAASILALSACSGSSVPAQPIVGGPFVAVVPTPVSSPTAGPSASPGMTPTPTATPTATPAPVPTPTATPVQTKQCTTIASGPTSNTGYVLIGVDGSFSGMQRIQLQGAATSVVYSAPANSFCTTYFFNNANNNVLSIGSRDGNLGLVLGHGLNGTATGYLYAAPFSAGNTALPALGTNLDISTSFTEPWSTVVIPDTGDEAVATVAYTFGNKLLILSGVQSGTLRPASQFSIPNDAVGLVLSSDGKTLVVRSSYGGGQPTVGVSVFRVDPVAPMAGPLGGTVAHTYNLTGTFTQTPAGVISNGRLGGRATTSTDPADASRVVLSGTVFVGASAGSGVQLLTGLPNAPSLGTPLGLAGTTQPALAVTVSRDGKYAFVATTQGIFTVGGIDTGTLAQIGLAYLPASAPRLNDAKTLATTVDGKYLVAATGSGNPCTSLGGMLFCGTLVVIPIGTGGVLGAPVLVYGAAGAVGTDNMLAF